MLNFIKNLLVWPWWPRRKPDPMPPPPPPPPRKLIPAQTKRVQWGDDPAQFYDCYIPEHYEDELVGGFGECHGGGWRRGAADADNVVTNKVPWLASLRLAFVSFSYRLGVDSTPRVEVITQAQDLAAGLAHLFQHGAENGIDTKRFALSGHSAGAHLGLLVGTNLDLLKAAGGAWWRCYVSMDTAASDVSKTMKVVPYLSKDLQKVYTDAFNSAEPYAGPDYFHECDPMGQMQAKMPPLLMVVSDDRGPGDLDSAIDFVAKARTFGTNARDPLVVGLKHGEINGNLGLKDTPENAAYTEAVEDFILLFLPKAA